MLAVVLLLALGALVGASATLAAPDLLVQQISADPFTNPDSQHGTEVEPDSFAHGDTVVAAFQVGRYVNQGGASGIGFSTSKDGGKTWTNGILPSLTVNSSPAGTFDRATDPTVGYDAAHGKWLVTSLGLKAPCTPDCQTAIVVSASSDGITWSAPVTIAPIVGSFAHDKEWIVCDNGAGSPRRGTCYVSYSDFTAGRRIVTRSSNDGGLSWSAAVGSPDGAATGLGTQPVVQPDGALVVVFLAGNAEATIGAIRSTDGGASFGSMAVVAESKRHVPTAMRGRALPSVETDKNGVIYAAWDDCRFRPSCSATPSTTGANDIVLSTSADGLTWSAPARVPIDDSSSGSDHFIPGLAVDPGTSGPTARLALAYHTFADATCTFATCQLRVGFVSSNDGGATWSAPVELSNEPMSLSWLPDTSQGRMVGDYISTSFVAGGAAVAVFPLARAAGVRFDQAMFAARVGVAPPPPPPPPPPPSGGGGGSPGTPPVAPPVTGPIPEPVPTPTPEPVRTTFLVSSLRAVPNRPRAGRAFTLQLRVRLGATGAPLTSGAALCSARIGSSSLRVTRRALSAGLVTCTWKVPPTAAGKTLRASIGASRGTRAVHVSRPFRVA